MANLTEKIDVLELVLNCIRENEQKLDGLVSRLEEVSEMVSVSGLLKPVGGSLMLIIPKDITSKHGMKRGDHVQAYIRRA